MLNVFCEWANKSQECKKNNVSESHPSNKSQWNTIKMDALKYYIIHSVNRSVYALSNARKKLLLTLFLILTCV